jgi:uncharacterized protein YidB (DUF937 family)
MRSVYTRKLIISSIALTLALGGGSLYVTKRSAFAESDAAKVQHDANSLQAKAGKGFPILDEAASILGTDKNALEKALQDNKSLVDIAKEKGISEADLTTKLLALRKGKIDEAVKAGKLDTAKAEQIKQHMAKHLTTMLNQKGLSSRHEQHSKGHHSGLRPDFEKLAGTLGISKEQLKSELNSGKSLTEIAAAKGISKEQLINTIKTQLTPSIEKFVTHKKPLEAK